MSNVTRTGGASRNSGTSATTFGSSQESQAQQEDAAKLASSDVSAGEPLNVYALVPTAGPDDPRWNNSPYQGEVVVAARTAGDARIVAAARELDFMEVDAAPAEGVTTAHASAFRSDKLYTVVEIEHGRTGLQRGLLAGTVSVATIKPTQV
ncbi:hypothetical protein MRS76_14245 [Rhizobiaceae bacterium n13]|uniref:Uncharacterized protein n=1 Tax=Ferirhizobium litorale TaxID=2927786 RepID=A0AAE3QFS9_9HYPH|nr:hypothetical protein [Fererhizobium litorale]MDI7863117.1 hypothetical protein [Fererhizobium litorale]MDI7923205.1 hypothetical protein [Fererhizobium litorale]